MKLPDFLVLFSLIWGSYGLSSQSYNRSFAHDSLAEAVAITSWGDSTIVAQGFGRKFLELEMLDSAGQPTGLKRVLAPRESISALRLLKLPNRRILLAASYITGCDVNIVYREDYYLLDDQLSIPNSSRYSRVINQSTPLTLSLKSVHLTEDGKILAVGEEGFRLFSAQNLQLEADSIFPGQFMGSILPYAPDSIYVKDLSGLQPSAFFYHPSSQSSSPAPVLGDELMALDSNHWLDWNQSSQVLRRLRKSDFQALDSIFFPTAALGFSPALFFPSPSGLVLQQDSLYFIFSSDFSQLLASGFYHSGFANDYRLSASQFEDGRLRALGIVEPQNAQMEVFDPQLGPAPRFLALSQNARLLNKRFSTIRMGSFPVFRIDVWADWEVTIVNSGTEVLQRLALQKHEGLNGDFCLPQWQNLSFDSLNLAPGDSFSFALSSFHQSIRNDTSEGEARLRLQAVMANGNIPVWTGTTDTSIAFGLSTQDWSLKPSLRLYPNPAKEQVWLEIPSALRQVALRYRLYHLTGTLAQSGALQKSERQSIALSALPPALYLLCIEDETGNTLAQTKLRVGL